MRHWNVGHLQNCILPARLTACRATNRGDALKWLVMPTAELCFVTNIGQRTSRPGQRFQKLLVQREQLLEDVSLSQLFLVVLRISESDGKREIFVVTRLKRLEIRSLRPPGLSSEATYKCRLRPRPRPRGPELGSQQVLKHEGQPDQRMQHTDPRLSRVWRPGLTPSGPCRHA